MGDGGWVVAVIIAVGVLVTFACVAVAFRVLLGLRPVKDAVHATAVVRGFSDTGGTISSPRTGPDAPVYRLSLLVSPPSAAPYEVQVDQPVPRLHVPFFVPGLVVPIDLHPSRPDVVKVAFDRMGEVGPGGVGGVGGVTPVVIQVSGDAVTGADGLVDRVRDGSLPTETGSAAALLATGARGTAVVKRAMPLGMTCGDVFPDADPRDAADPIWMLVMVVTVPGQDPFPAAVGHRVPAALVGRVLPGLRLPVAVDLANRNEKVAVDWDALDA